MNGNISQIILEKEKSNEKTSHVKQTNGKIPNEKQNEKSGKVKKKSHGLFR